MKFIVFITECKLCVTVELRNSLLVKKYRSYRQYLHEYMIEMEDH